jgi:hypothetical protein
MASSPRPGREVSEDLIAVEGNAAWLLDGASVPGSLETCCALNARWYVEQLSAALGQLLDLGSSIELTAALAEAIARVEKLHRAQCPQPDLGYGPSSAVAIVRRRGDVLDYLVLGDSTFILNWGDHPGRSDGSSETLLKSDKRLADVAPSLRAELRGLLAEGRGYTDPTYATLVGMLVSEERAARNKPGGYWIASNKPEAAAYSISGSVDLRSPPPFDNPANFVALLSDGLERSATVLQLHRRTFHLFRSLCTEGPFACIEAVRAREASDPTGLRFPRTTPSDDASAIVLELSMTGKP